MIVIVTLGVIACRPLERKYRTLLCDACSKLLPVSLYLTGWHV